MPGKVNPVIPESMNQMGYLIAGKNLTIQHAAENSCLELSLMFPVLADSLISILKLSASGVFIFGLHCVQHISAKPQRCKEHLENSTAYATLLVPKFGYDTFSRAVKDAVATGKQLRTIILQKKTLNPEEFDELVNKTI